MKPFIKLTYDRKTDEARLVGILRAYKNEYCNTKEGFWSLKFNYGFRLHFETEEEKVAFILK